jgi:hypothetical protein
LGQGGLHSLSVEPIAVDLEILEKADEFLLPSKAIED